MKRYLTLAIALILPLVSLTLAGCAPTGQPQEDLVGVTLYPSKAEASSGTNSVGAVSPEDVGHMVLGNEGEGIGRMRMTGRAGNPIYYYRFADVTMATDQTGQAAIPENGGTNTGSALGFLEDLGIPEGNPIPSFGNIPWGWIVAMAVSSVLLFIGVGRFVINFTDYHVFEVPVGKTTTGAGLEISDITIGVSLLPPARGATDDWARFDQLSWSEIEREFATALKGWVKSLVLDIEEYKELGRRLREALKDPEGYEFNPPWHGARISSLSVTSLNLPKKVEDAAAEKELLRLLGEGTLAFKQASGESTTEGIGLAALLAAAGFASGRGSISTTNIYSGGEKTK
ncbi:MAG: hypothetical protein AAB443_01630 [Patescibacteria group bacterium]